MLNNCISAKSASQILYIRDECIFPFSKCLIIGLCSYFASSLFTETTSELIPVPLSILEVFLSKNL